MPEAAVVASLSPQRLNQMLSVAAPQHPKMQAEIQSLGAPVAMLAPAVGTSFDGPRPTARSGEAWDHETVVRALRDVGSEVAGSGQGEGTVLTVRNLEPSVAQAALTEIALEKGWAQETAEGQVQWVQFDQVDAGWIESVLQRIKAFFTGRAERPPLPEAPDPLPATCKMAVVGDWGTSLYGAPRFTQWASQVADWDAVVHLGDTYYAGTSREIMRRLSRPWPVPQSPGTATLSRFLNGNHEMYSGGQAYFSLLSDFKQAHPQASSGFAMQNDHWLVVGLDTSWHGFRVEPAMRNGHLDSDQIEWLKRLMAQAGNRRVILMSHHPPFHFTGSENAELTSDLQWLWDLNKVAIWYWGHEHFGAQYNPAPYGFSGRCLGHGGLPEHREPVVRNAAVSQPIHGTACTWRLVSTPVGGQSVQAWVLDGPNPLVVPGPGADDYAPHGWAVLTLDGPNLVEDWYLADGAVRLLQP